MAIPKNEKSVFRHRGYRCSTCEILTQVFGNDPDPDACPNCGAAKDALKIQWDHVVTNTVHVEDTKPS